MKPKPIEYRAFLLRIWAPSPGEHPRASIRDVETGEIRTFGGLTDLCAWLGAAMSDRSRRSLISADDRSRR